MAIFLDSFKKPPPGATATKAINNTLHTSYGWAVIHVTIKNKTATVLLSATILTAAHGQVDVCSIVDKKTVNLGLQEGISGRCSNNGQPITCFLDNNEGWQCDGPAGTLRGTNVENVIIEACQCNLEKEMEIREENELMSD